MTFDEIETRCRTKTGMIIASVLHAGTIQRVADETGIPVDEVHQILMDIWEAVSSGLVSRGSDDAAGPSDPDCQSDNNDEVMRCEKK